MNLEDINWESLTRYLSEECSETEKRRVRNWIESSEQNREFYRFLKKIWDASGVGKSEWDVDGAWSRFQDSYPDIKEEPVAETESPPFKPFTLHTVRRKREWLGIAAIAASVLLTLVTVFYFTDYSEPVEEVAVVEMRELTTQNGQRMQFNLSDGSSVILNAGSRISIPEVFDEEGSREVRLEGEAFFEVTHDPDRPFKVIAGNAVTEVLGTSFNISTYGEALEVVVAHGKVALHDLIGSNFQIVEGFQMGVRNAEGTIQVRDVENLTTHLGWTRGELIFVDEPFIHALQKVERWYGVSIEVKIEDEQLYQRAFSAAFAERQPLSDVLDAIALTLDVRYYKADSTTYVFSK